MAFLDQAKDYYSAAAASSSASKPVLIYYAFLNAVKAYLLTMGHCPDLSTARHGMTEKLSSGGVELTDAYLVCFPSVSGTVNIFDEFLKATRGSALQTSLRLELPELLPQLVPGHRLWASAAGQTERFLGIHRIDCCKDSSTKEIWYRILLLEESLKRVNSSHQNCLEAAGLSTGWRDVGWDESADGRPLLCFEQISSVNYGHRPTDRIMDLVAKIRLKLWTTVVSAPPYRAYYLYVTPEAERDSILPQLASIYAVSFYLGSITRYRPQQFDSILTSEYGGLVETFLQEQPSQFLYLLASAFCRRDVTKAALV
ncbi:YaaC family protein [Gemmatimonadota bacterium]